MAVRRTDEEFKAEVFRRKELYTAQRDQRRKKMLYNSVFFLPVFLLATFLTVSLSIAMRPAGSADKNASENSNTKNHVIEIVSGDVKEKTVEELILNIKARETPSRDFIISEEQYLPGNKDVYNIVTPELDIWVYNRFIKIDGLYYPITENEYSIFLSIAEGE